MRWTSGHPWIFKSDVFERPTTSPGPVLVHDRAGRALGWALYSPHSEITLRLLDRNPDASMDAAWWHAKLERAIARRTALGAVTNACRLVHGEGDGLPSLVVDQFDRWLVVQLLSAGLEACREAILAAVDQLVRPLGILARNDASVREREGLARTVELLRGDVPREIEVAEHGVTYLAAPWTGQKTGAFIDQRENRHWIGSLAKGKGLDCFSYHGSFALHLAKGADAVVAVDSSSEALVRAAANARRNAAGNISFVEADVFDYLRVAEKAGERFDTIVVDPPAFAKSRNALASALRGYHDVNLRAMRLLSPGGLLFTASCSYHLTKPRFLEMLEGAAQDSGRRIALRGLSGQPLDHPEILSVPETGYLKGALVEAMD